jgi:hypothetical protein
MARLIVFPAADIFASVAVFAYFATFARQTYSSAAVLAEMASDNVPSASARATAPINLYSVRVFTTGTLRSSLESSSGSTSESRWLGVRHAGGARITSLAMTPFKPKLVLRKFFKSCKDKMQVSLKR